MSFDEKEEHPCDQDEHRGASAAVVRTIGSKAGEHTAHRSATAGSVVRWIAGAPHGNRTPEGDSEDHRTCRDGRSSHQRQGDAPPTPPWVSRHLPKDVKFGSKRRNPPRSTRTANGMDSRR